MCSRVACPPPHLTAGRPQASKLEQYWLTVSLDTLLPAMWNIVEQQASVPNSKIIVFFVTARCTQFFAEFFNSGGIEVMEIHSRKSQSARSKTSERFRNAKQAVLFTSDVSGTGPTHPTPRPISQGSLVVALMLSARHGLPGCVLRPPGRRAQLEGAVCPPHRPLGACQHASTGNVAAVQCR